MPKISIDLREGEPIELIRDTDQEIQDLITDIITRRSEKGGLIQVRLRPGVQCLFFASEVIRMEVDRLDDVDLRFTQIL